MNEHELREALHRMAGTPTAADGPSTETLTEAVRRRRRRRTVSVVAASAAAALAVVAAGVTASDLLAGGTTAPPATHPTSGPTSTAPSTPPPDCGNLTPVSFRNTPSKASTGADPHRLAASFALPGETTTVQQVDSKQFAVALVRADGTTRAVLTLRPWNQGQWGVTGTVACTTPATSKTCGATVRFGGISYRRMHLPAGVGPGAGQVYGQGTVTGCGPEPVGPVTVYQANEEPRSASLVVSLAGDVAYYVNARAGTTG